MSGGRIRWGFACVVGSRILGEMGRSRTEGNRYRGEAKSLQVSVSCELLLVVLGVAHGDRVVEEGRSTEYRNAEKQLTEDSGHLGDIAESEDRWG